MDKKLSVVQRTTDKTGWDKSNQFNSTDIKQIKIYAARNDRPLNAIPSPLARIHLFEAAFEMLDKDELEQTNYSGDAYKKIVSDCFDVFELIYNWNNHLKDKKDLAIIRWHQEPELKKLGGGTAGHKLLGETLRIYLGEEAFRLSDEIIILKYNGQPIAGSSPFTGFFTTPNTLAGLNIYNPLNRRNYFSKIISFGERKPEIRKFIYDFFYEGTLQAARSTQIVRNYLLKYENDIPAEPLRLEALSANFNHIFGQLLQSTSRKTDADYFEKNLVRINFSMNNDCFYTAKLVTNQKNANYLLPLTSVFFEDYKAAEIPSIVTINDIDGETVNVSIQKNGQTFIKKYRSAPSTEEEGKIIDLNETHKIKINLAIFPFIKVVQHGQNGGEVVPVEGLNDYFKVMLVMQDDNFQYQNSDFKLSFGIQGDVVGAPTDSNLLVAVDDRTLLDQHNQPNGSSYYTLRGKDKMNVCFDYVILDFPELADHAVRGAIVPKWRTRSLGAKQVDYAIDFGTTSTFIAYTDNKQRTSEPKALSFDMRKEDQEEEYPVALLSKSYAKSDKIKWIDTFQEGPGNFRESIAIQNEEFLPSLLNSERYRIPFRTVMYAKDGITDANRRLFSNANIGFIYQLKSTIYPVTELNQRFIPSLKWNVNTDKGYEELIKIYIEEIFLLLRLKTLLKDGDPKLSRISWFSPLSFSPEAQRVYQRLWEGKFKEVFHADTKQLNNITESEAPYYYYSKADHIDDPTAVLTIDIGGGTTDMMYIRDKPLLCTSVNFGANVLWGNGFSELVDTAKDNGIYNAVKSTIETRLRPTVLKGMNDNYTRSDSSYSSDEIINFWIANNADTDVLRELDNGQFRLTYLLHFTALIYHACQIIKSKNQVAPTCIIFSGNGSKYLDLIHTNDYISKICAYMAESVFKKEIKVPQIILPPENRKEATCYGGLYEQFDRKREFEPVTYLGTEQNGKTYKKYKDIDQDKPAVFAGVEQGFADFLDVFFAMNDERDLSFRTTFGIKTDLVAAKNYLSAKAAESLDVGYRKRKQTVGNEDPVTDSLFFNPLIGLLFKINKLSPKELDQYVPKEIWYASNIDGGENFIIDNLTKTSNHDTLYEITVNHLDPEQAEVILFQEDRALKKALSFPEGFLQPICEWEIYPTSKDQQIKIHQPGKLQKQDAHWFIKEKIRVEFI